MFQINVTKKLNINVTNRDTDIITGLVSFTLFDIRVIGIVVLSDTFRVSRPKMGQFSVSDFIRHKARNISSFEVEAAVNAHPAVAACAAHGVATAQLESEAELKIAVVLHAGESLAAEDLARFVNDNAPYFFVPRYIEFVDELPSTPTGRVQKFKLRERGVTSETWDAEAAGFEVRR